MKEMLEPIVEEVTGGIGKNLSKAGDVLATEVLKESIKRSNTEKKAISDGRADITEYASQRLMDKMDEIDVPAEYAKLALINELETIVNKRSILDKIFGKAKIIVQTTPQDDTNSNDNIGEISDDWLNEFRDVACKKSSEEAQDLFAKVLAGEIRKPRSISLKTLTTLADMDQNVALLFKRFCSLCLICLDDPSLYHLTQSKANFKIKDARIPIVKDELFDGTAIAVDFKHEIPKVIEDSKFIYRLYGLRFEEFKLLMEYGLIVDRTSIDYYTFWFNNEIWGFLSPHASIPSASEDQKYVKLTGYALTNVGIELYNIVEFNTPPDYWSRISHFIKVHYDVNLFKYPKPKSRASSPQNIPSTEYSAVSGAVATPNDK